MKKILLLFYSLIALLCFPKLALSQCDVEITPSLNEPICNGTEVTYTATPSDTNIVAEYFWTIDSDTVSTESTYTSSNGVMELSLTMRALSGCTPDSIHIEMLSVDRAITAEYDVLTNECNQRSGDIEILSISGGTSPYTKDLITALNFSLGDEDIYDAVEFGDYPLIITDSNNCVDTTLIQMSSFECPSINPLPIFSPNDDGIGDTWVIENIEFYPNNEVFVFDRWGQRVYQKIGYDNNEGWKAEYLGIGLPVSSYFYVIKLNFSQSKDLVFKGPVSIIR